jgi:ion channel
VIAWYLRHRYTVLFVTLLATLALGPLREVLRLNARVFEAFVALNLVVAASLVSDRAGWRRAFFVVSVLVVGTLFVPATLLPPALAAVADVLWVLIAALAAVAAVRYALGASVVDREHVSAALSAYLLAGLVFAVLYVLIDRVWPGAIVDSAAGGETGLTLDSAVYFSYVTLATLGYGDVVPRDATARGVAVVEAIGAQLYLTVTVARLVGLHAQGMSRRNADREGGAS